MPPLRMELTEQYEPARNITAFRGSADSGFLVWRAGCIRICRVRCSDLCWRHHCRQSGQTSRLARAQMESSAGQRDQCHELGRDRDRRLAMAGGVRMGVHNAIRIEISKERS